MLEQHSFPRTSKWARHLQRLANVTNIEVDPQLRELAKETTYDATSSVLNSNWGTTEFAALQYVMDWNARCILLDRQDSTHARHIAIDAARQLGSKRILICEKTTDYDALTRWAVILKNACRDDKVTCLDPQNKKAHVRIKISGPDDAEIEWILATPSELSHPEFISEHKPDHVITRHEGKGIDYTFSDTFSGLSKEFIRNTVIIKTTEFWNSPADYNTNVSIGTIEHVLTEHLRLNLYHSKVPSVMATSPTVMAYYRPRGVRVDTMLFFEASGVCFSLVADRVSKHFKNVYSNGMLDASIGQHSNRREGIIQRYRRIQDEQCARLGTDIASLIDQALAGDVPARTALDQMKTQEWARLKAHIFFNSIRSIARSEEKTVVVAKHSEIRKYLGTQLNAHVVDVKTIESETQLMNFAYPHPNYKTFVDHAHPKIINTIIVDDISDLDVRMLEVADRIIFAEFPYSTADIADYVELTKVFRFRILFGTMRGTFEEPLVEKLLADFY